MYLVNLWIEHTNININNTFTYYSFDASITKGIRVLIEFNHKEIIGFVDSVIETDKSMEELNEAYGFEIKPIIKKIDEEALISDDLFDLAKWMSYHTVSSTISCFQAMLPSKLKPNSSSKDPLIQKWVKIDNKDVKLTKKQQECFDYVSNNKECELTDLRKKYKTVVNTLIEKECLIIFNKEKEASLDKDIQNDTELALNDSQKRAYDEILETDDLIYLLHGVTGSGKTEVYLQLASKILNEGKQVLILVPEIGLTPQMVERVEKRFGNNVAIYHSSLNNQEKYEQYQLVKHKKVNIVVGTRSAVFMPFDNLGLIVIDEEHDQSYKQDSLPRYHTKDVAIKRAEYFNAKVILGSATPSLESYARAIKKNYHLIELKGRINNTLPKVSLVNVKNAIRNRESYILTNALKEGIASCLNKHEQAIIMLNRRGYTSQLKCNSCQETITCPHCDLAMSYHADTKTLKCHTCGYEMKVPPVCPSCKKTTRYSSYGFGTQKVEEELQKDFPSARIIRMDADSTRLKNAHQTIFDKFAKQEADILLGTQMIAKGLDFPNVTLVGVINADAGLSRSDFRSTEVTFDLITQASGRSGRADKNGEVILQVFDPNHYAIKSAYRNDYIGFFNEEMKYRHAGGYPPYTYLISVLFTSTKSENAKKDAILFLDTLKSDAKILGPSELLKIHDLYRYRIILKGTNLDDMIESVHKCIDELQQNKKKMNISVDVNPLTLD